MNSNFPIIFGNPLSVSWPYSQSTQVAFDFQSISTFCGTTTGRLPPAPSSTPEGGVTSIIDGGATIADPDSPNFDGGVLTVSISANGSADDRLVVVHAGNGAGQVGVSGATVSYGGTAIGTIAGGTDEIQRNFWNHSVSTAAAAYVLAKHTNYPDPEEAFIAGLLHDLGKGRIPEEILFKPGKLDKV